MFLITNSSFSKSLASAFDSAFFNKLRMNRTDFSGQRPVKKTRRMIDGLVSTNEKDISLARCSRLTLGGTELLGLGGTSDSSSEPSERNDLLVLLDVGQVGVGLLEVHTCRVAEGETRVGSQRRKLDRGSLDGLRRVCLPFKAAATSRMFLKWVERYSPLDLETVGRGGRTIPISMEMGSDRLFGASIVW